jgi:hypothetical protein
MDDRPGDQGQKTLRIKPPIDTPAASQAFTPSAEQVPITIRVDLDQRQKITTITQDIGLPSIWLSDSCSVSICGTRTFGTS